MTYLHSKLKKVCGGGAKIWIANQNLWCLLCAVAWSKVRHFQICFLLLLGVTSNWNHCWRSTCVLLLTFQSVISKKAQFMFSSVYFHSCFAAEKGRSLLLNLLCQLPTKDISQALPCAQQFSVDTLFSKFQSFVFLFFMFAANQQSANWFEFGAKTVIKVSDKVLFN